MASTQCVRFVIAALVVVFTLMASLHLRYNLYPSAGFNPGRQEGEGRRRRLTTAALEPDHLRRWIATHPPAPTHRVSSHGNVTAYHSSAGELVWLDGKRRGKICKTARSKKVEAAAKSWLAYAARAWLPAGRAAPEPTAGERAALSYFRVGNESHHRRGRHLTAITNGFNKMVKKTKKSQKGKKSKKELEGHHQPIEPLHGVARHPFAKVGCATEGHPHDTDIYDITYLVVHNDCGNQQRDGAPKPRTLLFDLGASVGFEGVPGGVYAEMPKEGGGLAPSLPLFWRMYEDRCLEPDEVYAWEPNPKFKTTTTTTTAGEQSWWGELPASLRAKVHFYHDWVEERELGGGDETTGHPPQKPPSAGFGYAWPRGHSSFLDTLERVAKPEDFVAVKVDVDTASVELTIMEALAERPELAALVDEIFFEYHFKFDGLDFGWGATAWPPQDAWCADAHFTHSVAWNAWAPPSSWGSLDAKGQAEWAERDCNHKLAVNMEVPGSDVDVAVGLLHRLRVLGVRAHFWI